MTDASKSKQHSFSAAQPKEAKQFAWNCFLRQGNTLLLIAATILPIIMFVAGQGIYSMLYYAIADPSPWISNLMSACNVFMIVLTLPLLGGTMYMITGLAHGEDRQLKDIFYAYTSLRAWLRTWIALLIPALVLAAAIGVTALTVSLSNGMVALTQLMEQGPALLYGNLFQSAGILFTIIIGLICWIISGIIMPFPWLVFSSPQEPVGFLFVRSLARMRGHLLAFVWLQISFIGWLLLSVVTVGILLVIFVIPFYMLTLVRYADGLNDTIKFENEI